MTTPDTVALAKAALDINTYADHDFECATNNGDPCSCGYRDANVLLLDLAEQVARRPSVDPGVVERVRDYCERVCSRAEILRRYADTGGLDTYQAVADTDADQEEQLAADLRALLAIATPSTMDEA